MFYDCRFASSRAHKAHILKRNPRNTSWTVLYRRKHKKGAEEDVSKKRNKRTQKFQRAVVGATLQVRRHIFIESDQIIIHSSIFKYLTFQDIMAKRNQKPEVRKAQREQAVRAAKDAKKQTATKKPAGDKKAQKAQKAVKNVQKAAPRVGGKR